MSLVSSLVVVVFSDCCAGSVSAVSRNGVYMYSGNVSRVFNKSRLFLRYNCPRDCTINDLGAIGLFHNMSLFPVLSTPDSYIVSCFNI